MPPRGPSPPLPTPAPGAIRSVIQRSLPGLYPLTARRTAPPSRGCQRSSRRSPTATGVKRVGRPVWLRRVHGDSVGPEQHGVPAPDRNHQFTTVGPLNGAMDEERLAVQFAPQARRDVKRVRSLAGAKSFCPQGCRIRFGRDGDFDSGPVAVHSSGPADRTAAGGGISDRRRCAMVRLVAHIRSSATC